MKKKAGKKANELEEKWGPINEEQFQYLSEEIFEQCLRERLAQPDCNAGVIIDGLKSKYYPNELFAMKYLLSVFGE